MKIISITEFSTTEGTAKDTFLLLDTRAGLFFRVITGTFETPPFSINQEEVPVLMLHGDREQKNVSLTIKNNSLKITQGYRQSGHGYLITEANDDWIDSHELHQVFINSESIVRVRTPSAAYAVSANAYQNQIELRTTEITATSSPLFTVYVDTADGNQYLCPCTFTPYQISSDPVRYSYYYTRLPRALTAYQQN